MYKIKKKIEKILEGEYKDYHEYKDYKYIASLECIEADTDREFTIYNDQCIFPTPNGFWDKYSKRDCVFGRTLEELNENIEKLMKVVRVIIDNRRSSKIEDIEI